MILHMYICIHVYIYIYIHMSLIFWLALLSSQPGAPGDVFGFVSLIHLLVPSWETIGKLPKKWWLVTILAMRIVWWYMMVYVHCEHTKSCFIKPYLQVGWPYGCVLEWGVPLNRPSHEGPWLSIQICGDMYSHGYWLSSAYSCCSENINYDHLILP